MYHILPPERQRQYGPFRWKNQSLGLAAGIARADPERLIELAVAIFARIGGVDEQVNRAAAKRDFDLLAAREERAGTRFEAETVQCGLAKRAFDSSAEIGGDDELAGLERPRQCSLELAFGLSGLKLGPIDADPGAATRRLCTNVGSNLPVGPQSKTDQIGTRFMLARKDALSLGPVPSGLD